MLSMCPKWYSTCYTFLMLLSVLTLMVVRTTQKHPVSLVNFKRVVCFCIIPWEFPRLQTYKLFFFRDIFVLYIVSLFCYSYFIQHSRLTFSNSGVVVGMLSSFLSLHLSHRTSHFHFSGTVCFGCRGIFIYFHYCYCTFLCTFFEQREYNLLRRQAFFLILRIYPL
jgi:hypothetical protein